MKIKSLALLVCVALSSFSALADDITFSDIAREGASYPAVMVKMKPTSGLTRQQLPTLLNLHDTSLSARPAFVHATARGTELSELQALDAKYGFDRYLRIDLPTDKTHDVTYINRIISELKENANVEVVYPEPIASIPGISKPGRSSAAADLAVADYRSLQYYLSAPNDIVPGYKLGGINRDSVNQYTGHEGENVTILSNEIGTWNQDHVNLPKALFSIGAPRPLEGFDHDTAAVGIMAARDIGTGIRGITWKTQVAWGSEDDNGLYGAIPKMQAGDVVEISTQYNWGSIAGCSNPCYQPLESVQATFDLIKALTDKGVYVVTSAGNGGLNLDHSDFEGRFDLNVRDSGAIMVGAAEPTTGERAGFSNYGSRISSSSWGEKVTTTGYTDLSSAQNANYTRIFNGTSSAAPIVAGVVASLSSIAQAHGKIVSPKQMRDILKQTGTPLLNNASSQISTQPDMGRAVQAILGLDGDNNGDQTQNTDAAFINALKMAVNSTDNGDSVTFNGDVTSTSAATSTPSYSWTLPAGAQGSNSGTSSQSFTINKTSEQQTLTVTVDVKAGTESGQLIQIITVPALTVTGQYPTWDSNTAYLAHDKVSWKGSDYEAKWWTKGNEPGASDAWENLNASQVTEWNASDAYNAGDIVLFDGHTWRAKWWTKGNQPGTNDVWEQIS